MATLDADDLAAIAALIEARVWTAAEREQLRYRQGIDGTAVAPSTATGAKLGDVVFTQWIIDSSATFGKLAWEIITQDAETFRFHDIDHPANEMTYSAEDGALSVGVLSADLLGDIIGKVLGGGASAFVGAGVRADNSGILAGMAGTGFDTATDSLEAIRDDVDATLAKQEEILAAVGGKVTVNILPAVGIVADRSPGSTISPVVGETISQSITLYQTDGVTPFSLAGKTLAIPFETMQGVDVAVVANADITISGDDDNVVTFAYPSAVTSSERTLRFAIKDAAAPLTEYLKGLCNVTSGPRVDT